MAKKQKSAHHNDTYATDEYRLFDTKRKSHYPYSQRSGYERENLGGYHHIGPYNDNWTDKRLCKKVCRISQFDRDDDEMA